MKKLALIGLVVASVLSLCGRSVGQQKPSQGEKHVSVPQAPLDLVIARPFEIDKPMEFVVNGNKEKISKGYILVLKAEHGLLEPKNSPDFVLFADRAVAQKINVGYESGHVVVVTPKIDLEKSLIWFGSRLLPDRMTSQEIEQEHAAADRSGIKPFTKEKIDSALKAGGVPLKAKDMNELWFSIAPLIIKYSPQERDMAESLRKG